MNSKSTTFPRKEDREIFCPVNPFAFTTGRVKSGASPVFTGVGAGCSSEYTPQITTNRTTTMTIFSSPLRPFFGRFAFERTGMCLTALFLLMGTEYTAFVYTDYNLASWNRAWNGKTDVTGASDLLVAEMRVLYGLRLVWVRKDNYFGLEPMVLQGSSTMRSSPSTLTM